MRARKRSSLFLELVGSRSGSTPSGSDRRTAGREDHLVAAVQIVLGEPAHLGQNVRALSAQPRIPCRTRFIIEIRIICRETSVPWNGRLESPPVGDLLASPLAVGLEARDRLLGLSRVWPRFRASLRR